jgi:hypothetical protein
MFSFFKTRSDRDEVLPGTASPMQPTQPPHPPSAPTACAETTTRGEPFESLASLAKINGIIVIQHQARVAVVGALLISVLEHLPTAMRAGIAGSFREQIEDVLSLGDDRVMPEYFRSTLLTDVNRYLNVLR